MTFDEFAEASGRVAGSAKTFIVTCAATLIWLVSGLATGFTEAWNFWANTSTTVLTLLLAFVIQHTQNKNDRATQIKLDEIIRAQADARNELRGVERRSDDELDAIEREEEQP